MKFPGVNKVLEEVDSPINGKIRVLRSLGLGTYIQVNNLTASGGIVDVVWKNVLKKVYRKKHELKRVLILGLGGGSAAKRVKEIWPMATATGIDIDPIMIELGEKYLNFKNSEAIIGDAEEYTKKAVESGKKYDLILVDTYIGDVFPKKLENGEFLKNVGKLRNKDGLAVFNRLYYGEKRPEAMKFALKLEKIFPKVEYVYPEANLMLVCYN